MIGNNIVEIRKSKDMKAAALSRLVGITTAYMSEIETNKKRPSIEILSKIADALGVTVNDLLDESSINSNNTSVAETTVDPYTIVIEKAKSFEITPERLAKIIEFLKENK